ncbi:MAG TPA: hypothetical protein VES19_11670 [Candidatus Limnocylindrales bacterium]|nr:hypothetical protein [Candidatus Limnocylindrales bacterium]
MSMLTTEEAFRRLTIGDTDLVDAMAVHDSSDLVAMRLDTRTEALLLVGALIALDAPPSAYRTAVDTAMLAGATVDELLGVLVGVAGTVGSARVLSAAPRIALAAGYDVEAALEDLRAG